MDSDHGFVKMDDIIRSCIADKGYSTLHKYIRYLHYGLEGLREFMEGSGFDIRTEKLKMGSFKRVYFPKDYVGWTKLAIKIGDRLVPFVHDSTISKGDLENESSFSQVIGDDYIYRYEFMNFRNLYGMLDSFHIFGNGHNGVGYFTVNERMGYIQFSSDVTTTDVWMEYISDGFNPTTETLVPIRGANIIKEYINYKEAKNKFGASHRETIAMKQDYMEEWSNFNMKVSDLTYAGILDVTTRSMTHSLKHRG